MTVICRGDLRTSPNRMIAAEALPWAANSLYWKHQILHRSDTPSVSSYVLACIRGDILTGQFAPGTKLRLKVLAARYAASLAPVREALAVLSGAGLVLAENQRGFRVAPASRTDLIDIVLMRQQMEGMALERAIEMGDDKWIREICRAYDAFRGLSTRAGGNDPITDAWEAHHREFHFALISHCGSPTLLNFCSQLHDRFDRYRRLALPSSSYMAATADDHEDLKDAVTKRDKKLSMALLSQHIQAIGDVVLEHYDQRCV